MDGKHYRVHTEVGSTSGGRTGTVDCVVTLWSMTLLSWRNQRRRHRRAAQRYKVLALTTPPLFLSSFITSFISNLRNIHCHGTHDPASNRRYLRSQTHIPRGLYFQPSAPPSTPSSLRLRGSSWRSSAPSRWCVSQASTSRGSSYECIPVCDASHLC